uniref:NAD(P)H-binding protein n=1 Tax=Streptomyces asoensis TaxID=249586 RepID=UPI00209BC4CA|nr:NAD(P)H-binding protein [Streptomyces asoensis]
MIVVSAASGAFGRLVIDRRLARRPADRIVAAVRHPDGAADLAARGVEVRLDDYDAPATLRTAFEGADRLLLISSPELDSARRAGQHRAAVEAACDAGVGRTPSVRAGCIRLFDGLPCPCSPSPWW